jgi:hypothetical protein
MMLVSQHFVQKSNSMIVIRNIGALLVLVAGVVSGKLWI